MEHLDRKKFRADVLASYGAAPAQVEELLYYNDNVFDHSAVTSLQFPLPDEPFAPVWERYQEEASRDGAEALLRRCLVQLRFPIRQGIGDTPEYRDATRRGIGPPVRDGFELKRPDLLRVVLHPTSAGRIPLIIAGDREDFVALVRALTRRNEPVEISASMGACMVAGYNNWDRVAQLRAAWQASLPEPASEDLWNSEFQRLIPQKHLYQDRFILLSDGPYSGVTADALGIPGDEWKRLSLTIRREHECAHYFTRRVFSSMRNNLLDELIADYTGIVAATGSFRADWFLRFMGLEAFPTYRAGARLDIYRQDLSNASFAILQVLLTRVSANLERFHAAHADLLSSAAARALAIILLAEFTVEELASSEASALLADGLTRKLKIFHCDPEQPGRRGSGATP